MIPSSESDLLGSKRICAFFFVSFFRLIPSWASSLVGAALERVRVALLAPTSLSSPSSGSGENFGVDFPRKLT